GARERRVMDDLEIIERLAAIEARLDAIAAGLSKIHAWQAARPSAKDIADRLEEGVDTYGLAAQMVEVWRRQRFEVQGLHRDVGKLVEQVAGLEKALRQKAVGDEERG